MMKRSVERMKDGDVVDTGRLDEMQSKIRRMLQVAWRERGRYPGLENVADAMLKDHLGDDDSRRRVSSRIADAVRQDGIGPAIAALGAEGGHDAGLAPVFKKACRVLKSRQEELEFLARLDLSAPQASRILRKIDDEGYEGVEKNPYRLLDWPATYFEKDWDSNNFDPGLSLYQIDIAMVPDPDHAAWDHGFDANSPERLGAAVADILAGNAGETGSTYMTRDGIVQGLEEYPLYYISKKFNIGRGRITALERDSEFAASFRITDLDAKDGAHYQLKSMRSMEEKVEEFVDKMLEKKYDPGDPWDDADLSKHALAELHPAEKERRKKAYSSVLSGGMFVLSGKAGSGKTDAISTIIKRLKKDGVAPTYVVTPTGKAALVITERLKRDNQLNEELVIVTTIDRLLYALVGKHCRTSGLYKNYKDALKNFLEHGPAHFDEFREAASKVGLSPRALIIDEASMVDQTHMAALLSVVSGPTLKHLVVAGDERQLPPIGFGSPFTDIIHHLKSTNRDGRHIRLEGNLRFSKDTALGELAGLFEEDKEPSMPEIRHAIERAGDRGSAGSDKTLLVSYFDDAAGLEKIMTSGLSAIAGPSGRADGASIRDLIDQIITGNSQDTIDLDKVQILSPRRAGQFGTWATNQRIDTRWPLLASGAKVICEKNMYMDARKGRNRFRVLGLANGSMGCIKADGRPFFPYLDDLRKEYDELDDWEVRREIGRRSTEGERYDAKLALGYAITIHKAQGSSFDHTLLILSDIGRFVSRELLYTALTRAKQDVHLLVRGDLREKLPSLLSRAFVNSSTATRKTLLFGPKGSPFRSYRLVRRQGGTIEVRSKAEWMIAKLLDESGIDFAYEPDDLYEASRIRPDFKIAGKFYLEHLGLTHDNNYLTRWKQKRGEYRRLGLEGALITTSEGASPYFEANVRSIIENIQGGGLKGESGAYSLHHYVL